MQRRHCRVRRGQHNRLGAIRCRRSERCKLWQAVFSRAWSNHGTRVLRASAMFADLVFRQLFDAASSTYTYVLGDLHTRDAVLIDSVFEQHLRDAALLRELDLEARRRGGYALPRRPRHRRLDDAAGHRLSHCDLAALPAADPGRGHAARSRRSHCIRRSPPGGARHAGTHRRLHDAGARRPSPGLHRRRAADPRCRPLRLPARQCRAPCIARSSRRSSPCPTRACSFPAHDYSGRTVSSVAEERAAQPAHRRRRR